MANLSVYIPYREPIYHPNGIHFSKTFFDPTKIDVKSFPENAPEEVMIRFRELDPDDGTIWTSSGVKVKWNNPLDLTEIINEFDGSTLGIWVDF